MARSLLTIVRWTAGLLSGLAVLGVAAYAGLIAAGYRPVAVYSGSMVPTLGVGSLAVVRPVPAGTIGVGDVVTFSDPYMPGKLVTHRVVQVVRRPHGLGLAYRTKGDANPSRDPWTIVLPGRVGKLVFDVPFAGYGLVYLRTRELRTILILVAALGVVVPALRRIWGGSPAGAAA